jgi:hypothetical protein
MLNDVQAEDNLFLYLEYTCHVNLATVSYMSATRVNDKARNCTTFMHSLTCKIVALIIPTRVYMSLARVKKLKGKIMYPLIPVLGSSAINLYLQ